MTRDSFLDKLREAKAAHIKWHAYAQSLALGFETDDDSLPKLYTDCSFGKWYYRTGQFISNLPGFKEIEPLHIKLHEIYSKIYKTYITPAKKNILQKKQTAEKQKQKSMEILIDELKSISENLIAKINILEKSILAVNSEDFANIFITPNK